MLTSHTVRLADARDLSFIPSGSVHLVVTSPPYASLIHYSDGPNQLGSIQSYELFLSELDKVWGECLRILVPGGRVACVVGDVCISRREAGRHYVLPLSADIQVRARRIGFDNLTPIRWQKVANIRLEASTSSRFLGKPNLPNGVVKNDLEHILFLRKPGGYRKPTAQQEKLSFISTEQYAKWFVGVWTDVTGQIRTVHPAPYPLEIPRRLIQMFSFVGDTVVDPFAGTGTTALAALETGRHSISVEIEREYIALIRARFTRSAASAQVDFIVKPETPAAAARRAQLHDRLLTAFRGLFAGQKYEHRRSNLGDYVASFLYEDLVELGRSPKLVERVRAGRAAVNTANVTVGRAARRGDGTFGEVVPGLQAILLPDFVVPRGRIASIEIGAETKILAKAMIKQIDRVINDLKTQVQHFKTSNPRAICVGIVGINHALQYLSFEGEREFLTDGKRYKHPIDEAAAAADRLLRAAAPEFDEFLLLRFAATNMPPHPFEWINEAETRVEYAAVLTRISREYESRC